MPLTRKPSITDKSIADRGAQIAVANIRERLEALETLVNTIESQANQSSFQLSQRNATLANLISQINELTAAFEVLVDLLNGDDGIVVVVDGQLVARTLEAGDGVTIENPSGADGNPVISATGGNGYPFLTTELDDDILTEDGHRIRVE